MLCFLSSWLSLAIFLSDITCPFHFDNKTITHVMSFNHRNILLAYFSCHFVLSWCHSLSHSFNIFSSSCHQTFAGHDTRLVSNQTSSSSPSLQGNQQRSFKKSTFLFSTMESVVPGIKVRESMLLSLPSNFVQDSRKGVVMLVRYCNESFVFGQVN